MGSMKIFPASDRNASEMNTSNWYLQTPKETLDSHLGTPTWGSIYFNLVPLWVGWWYYFTVFTESDTSASYDTASDVASFGSLGMSQETGQLLVLREDSVEQIFLLSISWNMLGLGWKNCRVWSSEDQERQALGLPRCLIQHWFIQGCLNVHPILLWTQWRSIRSLCLSPEICGLGIGQKHSMNKIIPQRIRCNGVCHRLHVEQIENQ